MANGVGDACPCGAAGSRAKDICKCIIQCLDLWMDDAVDLLLEDTEHKARCGHLRRAQHYDAFISKRDIPA